MGPFSEFGAELGFIYGDRRCRPAQRTDNKAQRWNRRVIHEYLYSTDTDEILQPHPPSDNRPFSGENNHGGDIAVRAMS